MLTIYDASPEIARHIMTYLSGMVEFDIRYHDDVANVRLYGYPSIQYVDKDALRISFDVANFKVQFRIEITEFSKLEIE